MGGGSSIGAYMRKVAALERAVDKDEDPREAVLKYAKVIPLIHTTWAVVNPFLAR